MVLPLPPPSRNFASTPHWNKAIRRLRELETLEYAAGVDDHVPVRRALRTFAIDETSTSERGSSCQGGASSSSPTWIWCFDWVKPESVSKRALFPAEYNFFIDEEARRRVEIGLAVVVSSHPMGRLEDQESSHDCESAPRFFLPLTLYPPSISGHSYGTVQLSFCRKVWPPYGRPVASNAVLTLWPPQR